MTVYLIYLTTYCFNLFSNCTHVRYGDYQYIFLFWKFLFLDANQQLLLYEEHCLSVLGLLSPRAIVYIWAMNDNLDIWILAQPPIKTSGHHFGSFTAGHPGCAKFKLSERSHLSTTGSLAHVSRARGQQTCKVPNWKHAVMGLCIPPKNLCIFFI